VTAARIVILVEGTWGGDWAQPGSPFYRLLERAGFIIINFRGWTGNVDGVPNILAKGRHRDWIAGSYAFEYLVQLLRLQHPWCGHRGDRPFARRQPGPVCAAARQHHARPQHLRLLTSAARHAAGRGRGGRASRTLAARRVKGRDFMQWAGEVFDRQFRVVRERRWQIPGAENVENLIIPGIGHSKLLNDPAFLDLWETDGMFDFLHAEAVLGV
jgi:hypothetical protein